MNRTLLTSVLLFSFLLTSVVPVKAALITINNEGKGVWNVLPAQTDSLTVKNIIHTNGDIAMSRVKVQNVNGEVQLIVEQGDQTQEENVTGYVNEIIEIEQRETPAKIAILSSGEGFVLREDGIDAYTAYPITIEPSERRIVVETPTGEHFLGILPSKALTQLTKSSVIDNLESNQMTLTDGELGDIQYKVFGSKTLNVLNVMEYKVPITTFVSATDGKIVSIDQPVWLPIAAFLFS